MRFSRHLISVLKFHFNFLNPACHAVRYKYIGERINFLALSSYIFFLSSSVTSICSIAPIPLRKSIFFSYTFTPTVEISGPIRLLVAAHRISPWGLRFVPLARRSEAAENEIYEETEVVVFPRFTHLIVCVDFDP